MSLHHAAQHLASQGRFGDDTLVHMNPKEVAGLQALAQQKGTSLTINPHTGLPEAFGLGDLNPFRIVQGKGAIGESGFGSVLIGAALMAAGVPPMVFGAESALAGAAGAGLLTGGASALMGGGVKGALSSGLGAYGGASMYNAYNAPNAAAAPKAPASPASPTGGAVPAAPVAPAPTATYTPNPNPVVTTPPPGYFDNTMYGAENATTTAQADALKASIPPATPTTPTAAPGLMDQTGQFIKDYKWPLGGAALYALTQEKPKGVEPENPTPPGKIRPFVYDPKTQGLTQLRPYNAPGYADGGGIEEDPNAQMIPSYDPVVRMASGGLGSLGGYSDGGRMLKGPGDGMSDNIPAVIGGKQPARLADGEFVVPADVVSHLGNGSTDAGAKQLYKMMDRIRQQRTGKKRQAPEVNPHKAMPA